MIWIIFICGGIITIMAYFSELPESNRVFRLMKSFWFKILTTITLLVIIGIASYEKDKIDEKAHNDEIKKQSEKDSLSAIKNEEDKRKIIETFSEAFARNNLKIDNLIPTISDIKIKSQADGLLLSYEVNKVVEKVTLELGPSPFDETFDKSHGAGWLSLPTKIGVNTYKINFKEFGLGSRITLLFKTENPYHTLPLIEHNHFINSTTDVFLATEDGSPILTDDGKKILVEKKK